MTAPLWRLVAEGKAGPLRAAADRLTDLDASSLSISIFERGGPDHATLEALFDAAPDADAFLRLGGVDPGSLDHLHVAPLGEQDWVALSLAGLKPVEAGRFYLHGAHDTPAAPLAGSVPILIEANQAFGTGHHGTTKGCLIAFDALLSRGETFANVLDLGCGSGVLAIAAGKTTAARIIASDNDPVAIDVSVENFAANGVPHIETAVAEGLDDPTLAARAPFDLIFANILAGPLVILAPAIAAALAPGGRVILSGLLVEQRADVLAAYEHAGLALEFEGRLDGWSTLVARRP